MLVAEVGRNIKILITRVLKAKKSKCVWIKYGGKSNGDDVKRAIHKIFNQWPQRLSKSKFTSTSTTAQKQLIQGFFFNSRQRKERKFPKEFSFFHRSLFFYFRHQKAPHFIIF